MKRQGEVCDQLNDISVCLFLRNLAMRGQIGQVQSLHSIILQKFTFGKKSMRGLKNEWGTQGYLGTESFLCDTKWDAALYICQSQRTVWCKMLRM